MPATVARLMPEKKSFDSIQVLRGVAALAVVVHHACTMVLANGARPGWLNQFAMFRELGAAGVDVFFVISGFIMVYVSRHAFGRPGAARQFWTRRLLRIVPLYWFYTTLMLLLVLSPFAMKSAAISLPYTIRSYLFIPAFNPAAHLSLPMPLLEPGWTLTYEMFFYLVFGLWILWGRLETLVAFIVCAFAGAMLASRVLGTDTAIGAFFAQPIMFEFLFGASVGVAYVKGWRLGRTASWVCVLGASALFAATVFVRPELAARWLFWGIPAALLVLGALGLHAPPGRIGRGLVRLGDASYTLYLQHAFVTLTIGGLLKRSILVHRLPPDLLIVSVVAGCAVLAWVSYEWMERPMNHWFAARLLAPRTSTPPVAALAPTDAA